jgi:hypothetical protein
MVAPATKAKTAASVFLDMMAPEARQDEKTTTE